MAMEIFNSLYSQKYGIVADSAGLSVMPGDTISENSKKALSDIGIDSSYVSKSLSKEIVDKSLCIICLTNRHAQVVKAAFPFASNRVFCFKNDISDPYGCDLREYIICRDEIKNAIEQLLPLIEKTAKNDFEISHVIQSDIGIIHEIENQNFSRPWSEKAIEDFLSVSCNKIITLKHNGQAICYISYTQIDDEIQIANIATENGYKQKGAAYTLLSHLIESSKSDGVTTISLEVRPSNNKALGLYEKCGFSKVGIRKNFYSEPTEDAIILQLKTHFKNV